MSKEERTKEIRKAIELLGWLEVSDRIRRPEDRTILNELREKRDAELKASADKILEKNKIKF